MEKTKEEILNEKLDKRVYFSDAAKRQLLIMMEEYAAQFKYERPPEAGRHHLSPVAEFAEKLLNFIGKNDWSCVTDSENNVGWIMPAKFRESSMLVYDKDILNNKTLIEVFRQLLNEKPEHPSSLIGDAVEFAEFIVSHFDCEDFAHKPKWSGIMSGITKDDWTTEELYKLFLSTRSDH